MDTKLSASKFWIGTRMRGGRKSVGVILAPNNHLEGELTKIRHWIVIAMMFCVSCLVGTTHSIAAMITAKSPAYESLANTTAIDPPPRVSMFATITSTIQATALVLAWTICVIWALGIASYSIVLGALAIVAVTSTLLCGSLGFGRAKNYAPHRRGFVTDWMSMLHVPRVVLVLASIVTIIATVAVFVGAISGITIAAAFIFTAVIYVTLVSLSTFANTFGHRPLMTSLATATTMNGLPNNGQGNHGTTSYTLNFRRRLATSASARTAGSPSFSTA